MDDERRGGIGVTDYADTVAYLRAASPERSEEILARRGLTRAAWQAASGEWTRTIEEEMARGEHRWLLAYAAALRATGRRLAEDPQAIEKIEEIADLPVDDTRAALRTDAPAFAETSPAAVPHEPAITPSPLLSPLPGPPAHPVTNAEAPRPPVHLAALASTAPLDIQGLISKGLPFARSLAGVPGPSPVVKTPRAPTGTLMNIEVRAAAPTPFTSRPGAAAEPAVAREGASSQVPPLSFEQYVALCAEMTVFPARVDEILARAGVPRSALAELHATWRERLAADAELTGRWHPLYAHYQAWFGKTP
jgi:hypothetical protein